MLSHKRELQFVKSRFAEGAQTNELIVISGNPYYKFGDTYDEGSIAFDMKTKSVLGLVISCCDDFSMITPWRTVTDHFHATHGMRLRWKTGSV